MGPTTERLDVPAGAAPPAVGATEAAENPSELARLAAEVPAALRAVVAQAAQGVPDDDIAFVSGMLGRAQTMTTAEAVRVVQCVYPMLSEQAAEEHVAMLRDLPMPIINCIALGLSPEEIQRSKRALETMKSKPPGE